MQPFERDMLVKGLPLYLESLEGIPNQQVRGYLESYQLLGAVTCSAYKIGRMLLDGNWVTLQSFSQKENRAAKGTVIILHGYMDHIGLYSHLIERLLADGLDVVCYDLSGHGLSDGDPLLVDDFKHYGLQLAELIKQLSSSFTSPLHMIGQSTGAAVIMAQQLLYPSSTLLEMGERILLAPLVRPSLWRSIQQRFRWFKYVIKRVPRRYSYNSHDESFIRFITELDPLQHKHIPVRWVGAMLAWGDWIEQHKPVFGRIYMIQGTDDATVDWRHNMLVLGRLYPDLDLTLINGAKHHLVNESVFYRDQVFERVMRIINGKENKNGRP